MARGPIGLADGAAFGRVSPPLANASLPTPHRSTCRAFSILIDLVSPALLPIGMPFRLPNALTAIFNRLALIPLQLKREPLPPKKRKPRRKRKKI